LFRVASEQFAFDKLDLDGLGANHRGIVVLKNDDMEGRLEFLDMNFFLLIELQKLTYLLTDFQLSHPIA
jgi:hypothetical protein